MKAEVLKTPPPAAAPSSEGRHRYREFLVAVIVALLAHRRDLSALEGQSERLGHQMVASFLLVGLTSFVWTIAVPSSTFARILAVQTITWSPAACASMLTVLGASVVAPDVQALTRLMASFVMAVVAHAFFVRSEGDSSARTHLAVFVCGHVALIPCVGAPAAVPAEIKYLGFCAALLAGVNVVTLATAAHAPGAGAASTGADGERGVAAERRAASLKHLLAEAEVPQRPWNVLCPWPLLGWGAAR